MTHSLLKCWLLCICYSALTHLVWVSFLIIYIFLGGYKNLLYVKNIATNECRQARTQWDWPEDGELFGKWIGLSGWEPCAKHHRVSGQQVTAVWVHNASPIGARASRMASQDGPGRSGVRATPLLARHWNIIGRFLQTIHDLRATTIQI